MAFTQEATSFAEDVLDAVVLVFRQSWERLLKAWVYVPVGILLILLVCFGIDSLIRLSSVSFPASVACLIVLFVLLLVCEGVLGSKKTKKIISVLDIPCGFSLRYINIFFCPAFVMIPLGPSVSGTEVGKIIAVLFMGYIAMFVFTAYFVRALQKLLNVSKRAMTERAEELGHELDNIPLSNEDHRQTEPPSFASTPLSPLTRSNSFTELSGPSGAELEGFLQAPPKTQDPVQVTGTEGLVAPRKSLENSIRFIALNHTPAPLTRAQEWAAFVNTYLDILIYSIFFIFIGLPMYFITGYSMPAQLSLNILAYFVAFELPPSWRKILHPAMVSAVVTVVGIWVLAMCHGAAFTDALQSYQTKTRYLQLLRGADGLPMPGAGDIFSSVLDVSIVSLALPMVQYRHELKQQFLLIIVPNVTISILSLFGYPPLCHALGISPSRSLSFPSRSLTLALAQPATQNLGGDMSLVAVICIISGMLGVIMGPNLLKFLRIPEDDYITRGVTLGGNSSAIATALLLVSDPRAAAFSSLSMSLFGTITVAFTSIPPIVRIITALAGV